MPNSLIPEQEMTRRTRRGFIGLGLGAAVTVAGWEWLNSSVTPEGDIQGPLRSVLGVNERVVRNALFSHDHLAKTFPVSAIGKLKVNGDEGMNDDFDEDDWNLQVAPRGGVNGATLTMDDIQALPRHEEIIDFKCVEGWSTVTQFAGARFSDFTAKFAPGSEKAGYVSISTPDGGYYVGIDSDSALHPQTLLAWQMNGEDLTDEHGAPLRLVIPVKYGIKNIKRIGRIEYVESKPKDYWYQRGYDFYAGL